MEGHIRLPFRELCRNLLRESNLGHSENPRINAGVGVCIVDGRKPSVSMHPCSRGSGIGRAESLPQSWGKC